MRSLEQSASRLLCSCLYRAMGADVFGFLSWLQESEHWSREHRRAWRTRKLKEILTHCWTNIPFYRTYWGDHGLTPTRLGSLEDLALFPVLTKEILRENLKHMVSTAERGPRWKVNRTGGTTGEPLQYRQDIPLWALSFAFNLWGRGLAGYRLGHRMGVLGGYSVLPGNRGLRARLRSVLERQRLASGIRLDDESLLAVHAEFAAFCPRFLYGYPSAIAVFARVMREHRLTLPSVRGVFTTAELLLPAYRESIMSTFGCEVWDQYGANDGGIMAHECGKHEGHHYNDLQVIAETGASDTPGDVGGLIVTNLWNTSFPFIRYANGDSVALAGERCSCGAQFPLIAKVEGRTGDILETSDGRRLAGPGVATAMQPVQVERWQLVQRAPDRFEMRVIAPGGVRAEDRRHILAFLHHQLGQEIRAEVVAVDELETTSSGKLKPVRIDSGP